MNVETSIAAKTGAAAQRETVLVVDDSRAHRQLLTRSLARWGYKTLEAESGDGALAICKSRDVSLVISDWMMPGMSGVEFCRAFRSLERDHPGYFILLTAQTERAVLAEGLESGADDFLSKPVSNIELKARLHAGERVLEAQRALAAKNAELTDTLHELSNAYSAIDRDLLEAKRFQEALVPDLYVPFGSFDVSLLFKPSGHVGGDMVGYFPIREGVVGLYAVDVSGHGVSSALMTARIASYFSGTAPERNFALCRTDEGYQMLPPEEVCERLNALLHKDAESDHYLTMVLAELSTETGDIRMCQAGHPSPLIMRADGTVEFMDICGMPIGLVETAIYESTCFALAPGDRLFLYSDGVTECPSPSGDLLDEHGLKAIMERHGAARGAKALSALVTDLEAHARQSDFPDDLSAVLIERQRG